MYSKEEVIAIVEAWIDDTNSHEEFKDWLLDNGHPTAADLGFEGIS